jgi:hemolysin III
VTSLNTRPDRPTPAVIGKPRMRGWLHTYAFFAALVSGIVLCVVASSRGGIAPLVSCAIYSITVCGLFGTSALYHRRVWSHRNYQIMRRLDHSMIFVFIAGTYTPFSVLLLSRTKAEVILSIVWGGAVLGVAMKMITPNAPRWLSAPLYVLLGWVAIAVLPDFERAGGTSVVALMLIGGAFYTLGAVLYALRKPNPWPKTFGHHEFFHACTLLAAVSHQIGIYFALFAK